MATYHEFPSQQGVFNPPACPHIITGHMGYSLIRQQCALKAGLLAAALPKAMLKSESH